MQARSDPDCSDARLGQMKVAQSQETHAGPKALQDILFSAFGSRKLQPALRSQVACTAQNLTALSELTAYTRLLPHVS